MTKKDVLFNDVINFLQKQELFWQYADADRARKKFVSCIIACLWYIDGRKRV